MANPSGLDEKVLLQDTPEGLERGSMPPDFEADVEKATEDEAKSTDRYCLVIFQCDDQSMIGQTLAFKVRKLIEDGIPWGENPEIDVWLESPGGSADSAYKIMLLLRKYGSRIRVVIPDYAKSSATLMALGADEIVMGPAAELGPLDAQIGHYEHEGRTISALDYADSVEDLAATCLRMVLRGGALVVQRTGLTRKESLTAVFDFTAKFIEPIVSKLDPALIHRSSNQLRVASEYASRLMDMRTLSPQDESEVKKELPDFLVKEYPAHGFVISRDEASELGLPVKDASDYDYWDIARSLHRKSEESGTTIIQLLSPEQLSKLAESREGTDG